MPFVFSYGTLQQDEVQIATFGRLLKGFEDALVGFIPTKVEIKDAELAESLGSTHHDNAEYTGDPEHLVPGVALEITDAEFAKADEYERAADYVRIRATLASGRGSWVYVDAKSAPKNAIGS